MNKLTRGYYWIKIDENDVSEVAYYSEWKKGFYRISSDKVYKDIYQIITKIQPPEIMNDQIDMFNTIAKAVAPDDVFQKDIVEDIGKRKEKNKSQNEIILSYFRENAGRGFTAWQIKRALNMTLITSVRRAMSTLMKYDLLEKLDETTIEIQGERNHYYRAI